MLQDYTYEEQESGRTDTLIQALERCERLEKQLNIAVEALEFYEKPLSSFHPEYNIAQHHKKAVEALAKIRRLKYEFIKINFNIS